MNMHSNKELTFWSRKCDLNVEIEQWKYFHDHFLTQNVTILVDNIRNKKKLVVHDNYSREAFRVVGSSYFIRFQTSSEINCFRSLFGSTCIKGVRQKNHR